MSYKIDEEILLNTDPEKVKQKSRKKIDLEELLHTYRYPLTFLLLGLLLLGVGVIFAKSSFFEKPKIEILEGMEEGQEVKTELVVEISGAVEKPGVYKLPGGARVEDLLIAAGGISADADRGWVERMINRAAKLSDGQKIYIPLQSEQSNVESAKSEGEVKVYQGGQGSGIENLVNINTASQKELEDLPGIGPVYAQSIIEHRPYSDVPELLSKGALKKNVYEKIKDRLTVY